MALKPGFTLRPAFYLDTHWKAQRDDPSSRVPVSMGDLGGVYCPCLGPDPALAVTGIWGVKSADGNVLSLVLSLFLGLSKKISKLFIK